MQAHKQDLYSGCQTGNHDIVIATTLSLQKVHQKDTTTENIEGMKQNRMIIINWFRLWWRGKEKRRGEGDIIWKPSIQFTTGVYHITSHKSIKLFLNELFEYNRSCNSYKPSSILSIQEAWKDGRSAISIKQISNQKKHIVSPEDISKN